MHLDHGPVVEHKDEQSFRKCGTWNNRWKRQKYFFVFFLSHPLLSLSLCLTFFVLLEKMSNLESSLEKTKIVHFCFCLFCIVSSLICNSEFSLHFILWTNYRNQSLLRYSVIQAFKMLWSNAHVFA